MSASRVLSQLALRRGRMALNSSNTTTRFPSSVPCCHHSLITTPYRAATCTVPALRQGLSKFGRVRSSIPVTQLGSSSRSFTSTVPLSSATDGKGSSGPRPMKVAIIGQSLFGREVCFHPVVFKNVHSVCLQWSPSII